MLSGDPQLDRSSVQQRHASCGGGVGIHTLNIRMTVPHIVTSQVRWNYKRCCIGLNYRQWRKLNTGNMDSTGADTLARLHGTTLHAIEASACFFQLVRRHTCAGSCSCAVVFVVAGRADLIGGRATGLSDCAIGDVVASSRGGENHVAACNLTGTFPSV